MGVHRRAAPGVYPGNAKRQFVQGGLSGQDAALPEQRFYHPGMLFGWRVCGQGRAACAGREACDVEGVFNREAEVALAQGKSFYITIALSNRLHNSHLNQKK
jgi:hypothetical protein